MTNPSDAPNMGRIEERDGDEGHRHYLMGRGVHCGDQLELRLAGGTWLPVRFELEHRRDGWKAPVLYVGLGGGESVCFAAPFNAELRWGRR